MNADSFRIVIQIFKNTIVVFQDNYKRQFKTERKRKEKEREPRMGRLVLIGAFSHRMMALRTNYP